MTKQRKRTKRKPPARINAKPERIAEALFAPIDQKVKKRRAE
ncbi:MAG: hypothetical protein OXG05_13830 [Gammaproteobacteria bacterium]|nr:hypothetical protein [Gammaproteobacteria bacterium]